MASLAVSMMMGVGIFFGPSLTAREFPDSRIVLALWGVGGVVAVTGAWVFGRLAARYPLSGGPYVYVREAWGPLPAFLFAWTSFVIIAPTSLAVLASLFASNLAELSPLTPRGLALMALWVLVAAAFANVIGVKSGGRVQAAMTGLKLALVVGVLALLARASSPALAPALAPAQGRWSVAFVGVLFAYGGWEYAVLASEEVKDAARTIPRALVAGAAVVTLLYMAATAAFLAALGPAGVASASALAPEAARSVGLPEVFPLFVALAVALSAAGTVNAITLLGPRATFAVARDFAEWRSRGADEAAVSSSARDGLLPERAARLSRWGTPLAAIVAQVLLASAFLLLGGFETVAAYTVLGTGLFIVLSALGLLRLAPERKLAETLAALVVAGVYAWFILFQLVEAPRVALPALGLIAAGAVPYFVFRASRQATRDPVEP